MRPRTVAIVILVLLFGALGTRFLVVRNNWLPFDDQAVLRRSVSVTLYYMADQTQKKLLIGDAAELRELLATLRIDNDHDYFFQQPRYSAYAPIVEFQFPNGRKQAYTLNETYQLGPFAVDPAFHNKLCDLVSRHEKKRFETLILHFFPAAEKVAPGGEPKNDDKK
jgi:hypothetical protein